MRIPGLESDTPQPYENEKQIHFWLFKLMFQRMMSSVSVSSNVGERIQVTVQEEWEAYGSGPGSIRFLLRHSHPRCMMGSLSAVEKNGVRSLSGKRTTGDDHIKLSKSVLENTHIAGVFSDFYSINIIDT